jgi:hypothetical protein
MAGVIFPSRPGQVALLLGEADLGLPFAVDGMSGSWFPTFHAILTGVQFALDGNFQLTHTCDNIAYVYAFGDRVSMLEFTGIAFADGCGAVGGQATGIDLVLAWYKQNRIAVRPTPVQAQVGATAAGRFRGFLTRMGGEMSNPENRLTTFTLRLQTFPGD